MSKAASGTRAKSKVRSSATIGAERKGAGMTGVGGVGGEKKEIEGTVSIEEEYEDEEEEEEEASIISETPSLSRIRYIPSLREPSRTFRKFIFVWHIIILLMSLGMVGIGFYLTFGADSAIHDAVENSPHVEVYNHFIRMDVKPPRLKHFGKLIDEFAFALHHYGWTFLASTILYVSFFYHKFTFTWPILSLITLVSVTVQTSNVLVRLAPTNQLSIDMQKTLKERLKTYKIRDSSPTSLEYDYIAIWGQCCGISSKYDFQLQVLRYVQRSPLGVSNVEVFRVPATCCDKESFSKGIKGVILCATRMKYVNDRTCFQVIYDFFNKYRPAYVIALALMLLDVFIHAFMYFKMVRVQTKRFNYEDLNILERQRQAKWDRAPGIATGKSEKFLVTVDTPRIAG